MKVRPDTAPPPTSPYVSPWINLTATFLCCLFSLTVKDRIDWQKRTSTQQSAPPPPSCTPLDVVDGYAFLLRKIENSIAGGGPGTLLTVCTNYLMLPSTYTVSVSLRPLSSSASETASIDPSSLSLTSRRSQVSMCSDICDRMALTLRMQSSHTPPDTTTCRSLV